MNKNWVPFDHILVLALSLSLTLIPFRLIIGWHGIRYIRRKSILFHITSAATAGYYERNFKNHKRVFDSMLSNLQYIHRHTHTQLLHTYACDENEIIVSNIIIYTPYRVVPIYVCVCALNVYSQILVLDEFNFLRTIYNLNECLPCSLCVLDFLSFYRSSANFETTSTTTMTRERERAKKEFLHNMYTCIGIHHFIWALFNGIAFKYHWEFISNDFLFVCVFFGRILVGLLFGYLLRLSSRLCSANEKCKIGLPSLCFFLRPFLYSLFLFRFFFFLKRTFTRTKPIFSPFEHFSTFFLCAIDCCCCYSNPKQHFM